ncbi:sugar 3,4-ketoisomerase [Helicobacter marmotae]|uniref:WxcM-like domain-containing protein n=1 Tax=Helicobacter marmotae TaxID=152490 RepID=A0A3D8I6A0_9HELI|nr:FdtA/QdtA family cupin domain-containing protein [Helicobacter marmotae]RDU60682.1 WxcM-like domain-containing protein [Helicobacter marmotae]
MNYRLLDLAPKADSRGKLVALEGERNIPFSIKRVYYIYDTTPNEVRGKHAHKHLEQVVIAICGACEFVLDNGKKRESIWLNRPDIGLYIGTNIWREMRNFSYGAKLMILASDYYDEGEYIRDYEQFLKEVR